MAEGWDYERYEAYMTRFAADSRRPLVRTIEEAQSKWGLRHLSRSEFDALALRAADDPHLRARWMKRLNLGYDQVKAELSREIESDFATIPYSDRDDEGGERGDAA